MANLGANFYPRLVQISEELGMKPEDLLAVMVSESGIDPSAHEKTYNGGGLLGFMPQTLKNLHYEGTPEDFRKTSGEQQLEYVKKMVKSFMGFNGGKPFKSATQYYVANFVPAALKLPGVKAEDPDYAFLEENPETIKTKDGVFSKKYYDVGIRLTPGQEKSFYTANPLFHGKTKGAITYGDMERQVNKNKQSAAYKNAISAMQKATSYTASSDAPTSSSHSTGITGYIEEFFSKLKNLMHQFSFANDSKTNYNITIYGSGDNSDNIEYARILSTATEEYLGAKTAIYHDLRGTHIICSIDGDNKVIYAALNELTVGVSEAFKHATMPIGSIINRGVVRCNVGSRLTPLNARIADLHHRKFKLKFARLK